MTLTHLPTNRRAIKVGDLIGQREVIALVAPAPGSRDRRYTVRCDCGRETTTSASNLRRSPTCGCDNPGRFGVDGPAVPAEPLLTFAAARAMRLDIEGLPGQEQYGGTLTTGAERGTFGLYWVDTYCCTVLKVHPCEVYGPAWFDFGTETLAEAA